MWWVLRSYDMNNKMITSIEIYDTKVKLSVDSIAVDAIYAGTRSMDNKTNGF